MRLRPEKPVGIYMSDILEGMQNAPSAIDRRSALGLAIGLAAGGLAGASPAAAQRRGGTLTVALPYDNDTLNPYSTGFLHDVQCTVLEGLIEPNEKAEYVPVLALEVPTVQNGLIKVTADGKRMSITYRLRPNVKWHDGAPFTSEDVRFTWEAVKDPNFIGENKDGTQDIESIDTPDALTVVCNYNTVTPTFASSLFTNGILPSHLLKGKNLNTDPWNQMPIGTGPFVMKEFRRSQYIIVERNPNYWARDEAGGQLPYIDRIIYRPSPDQTAMMTQLKAGEVDFAYTLPYTQAAQVTASPNLLLVPNRFLSWQYLAFNFRNDVLKEQPVRQALARAVNKEAICRALGNYPYPVKSVVLPQFSYYDPDGIEIKFDPVEAGKILDNAGWKMGSDNVRIKDGKRMSFRFVIQAGLTADEIAQQIMIANFKAIGVEVSADNKTGSAWLTARYKGGYDLLYGRWLVSASPNYSVWYSSKGPNNGMGYSNPELDAIIYKTEHTLDDAERKAAFKDFQRIMATDLPVFAINSNVNLIAVTKRLKNFVPNPTNRTNFINPTKWYLES